MQLFESSTAGKLTLPCPLGHLVPHAPPMLVEGTLQQAFLTDTQGLDCAAEALAPATGPYVHQGRVMPEYCIELLGQTLAAGHRFLTRTTRADPCRGVLAGIDRFSWFRTVAPGDRLRTRVRTELTFGPFLVVHTTIVRAAEEVACGRLKIRLESDSPDTQPQSLLPADPFIAGPSLLEALQTMALDQCGIDKTGKVTGSFHFAPEFSAFQGHFPGRPILPAVVQFAAVQLILEQILQAQLRPIELEGLKLNRPILPGEQISITAVPAWNGPETSVSFSITGPEGRAASGAARFRNAGQGDCHVGTSA